MFFTLKKLLEFFHLPHVVVFHCFWTQNYINYTVGTWLVRTAVQTQHCLNLCSDSVIYEQIFTLEAVLDRKISKKCIFRKKVNFRSLQQNEISRIQLDKG